MTLFTPADAQETAEVVAWACAEEEPLELLAGGSKRPLGRPLQVAHALDVSRLSGILDYEPAELVLTARAATPLPEIEAALAERRQMLAFEPPDWRALLGATDRTQTLGGVMACNLAGPRRIAGGAARDHFLGFHAVNGRGERFKAGGKVVKNVTGYDLCKLLAGSHGTLAALTEISIKVLPRPETARTLLFADLDDAAALRLLCDAMGSPHEVSGAAHLPAPVAARLRIAATDAAITALRLEGPAPSVAYRAEALRRELGGGEELDADDTEQFWREIGDASPLAEPGDRAIWRLSAPPASGAGVVAAIRGRLAVDAFYDWGGGLIWLAVDAAEEACGAPAIRAGCGDIGHATLIRATETARAAVEVFQPLSAAVAGLSSRVKNSFDPRRVLNPGRMYAGI